MKYVANIFEEKDFVFNVDEKALKVEGVTLDDAARTELVNKFTSRVHGYKAEVQKAGKDVVADFPMDTMVPFVFMYYAIQFSETYKFDNDFIEMGFSYDHLKLLKPKQAKLLKNIKGGLYKEKNANGDAALFQLMIDDNFFNAFSSIAVSIDKMFSMREVLKGNKKAAPFLDMLTTTFVGTVLP